MHLRDILQFLCRFAPLELAEDWDNVGLLVGDPDREVTRVITCLTLTPDVAEEAVSQRAELVVSHHPVLFRAVQRLTAETSEGGMLLKLIASGVAVFSPHTAFDSAPEGINAELAQRLGLVDVQPLRPLPENPSIGAGRYGRLIESAPLEEILKLVLQVFGIRELQFVGDRQRMVSKVAVACGSAGEFLPDAQAVGCDLYITGETRFHTCLEARTAGIGLILAGHYATERPALEWLAARLASAFPNLTVWASRVETDPLQWWRANE